MRPSNFTTRSRFALVLGLSAVVLNVYWIIVVDIAAAVDDVPSWIVAALTVVRLPGIALFVFALLQARRAPVDAISAEPPADHFRPQIPVAIELSMWAMIPVGLLIPLVLWAQWDVPLWISAWVGVAFVLSAPVSVSGFLARYELTQDALVVRFWPVGRRSLGWQDMTVVRAAVPNILNQLIVERSNGRPVRLIAPVDRKQFLRAISAPSPRTHAT